MNAILTASASTAAASAPQSAKQPVVRDLQQHPRLVGQDGPLRRIGNRAGRWSATGRADGQSAPHLIHEQRLPDHATLVQSSRATTLQGSGRARYFSSACCPAFTGSRSVFMNI